MVASESLSTTAAPYRHCLRPRGRSDHGQHHSYSVGSRHGGVQELGGVAAAAGALVGSLRMRMVQLDQPVAAVAGRCSGEVLLL